MDVLLQVCLVFLFVTYNAIPSIGLVIDVRLVNGPSRYEGTLEYTTNNVTWQTLCGIYFDFEDARVVCQHIGAYGTNKAIANSPFGSDFDLPKSHLDCEEGGIDISDCLLLALAANNHCPIGSIGAAICYDDTYLGCYNDSLSDRVLPGDPLTEKNTMTIDNCITHCRESTMADYVYAGVEFGKECYCGVAGADYSRLGAAEDGDADCQTLCTGDAYSSCGGPGHIAVFKIPESSQPVTPPETVVVTTEDADTSSAIQQSTTAVGLTTVTSTYWEDGTRPDITTSIFPTQPTQLCASPSNGPIIGLGVVVLLFAIYSISLTVLYLRIRRSPREKQPLEGVKPEGDTYTDLDIQLHSATPENRGPLYQDLLPIEGAPNPPNQSAVGRTDMDSGCYVNQQMANPQEAMRQRAKPEGDHQHYEDFV